MIKDISIIRKELENFEELDLHDISELPDDLTKNCAIKYITLDKKGEESFYKGGNFVTFGDECIILTNNNRTWSVPIRKKNPDGTTNYTSRFYIKDKEVTCDKKVQELNDIIKYQQNIIEKMSQRLTDLELIKAKVSQEKQDYEELLQQNRFNYKEKCIETREKDEKIKQYEEVIQKLANSHQMFH